MLVIGIGSSWATLQDGVYSLHANYEASASHARGYIVYNSSYSVPVLADIQWSNYSGNGVTRASCGDGQYWYVRTYNDKTYFYNLGAGKFLGPKTGSSESIASLVNEATGLYYDEPATGYTRIKSAPQSGAWFLGACCGWAKGQNVRWLASTEGASQYMTYTLLADGMTTYAAQIAVADRLIDPSYDVVSGYAAWLDYTFSESTKKTNKHSPADRVITNAGNAGISGNSLETDTGYDTDNSYNDDGTLKVMSTPYRSITWPTNYTVAVAGNVPDVENGCLVAFGTHDGGYLAILRGDANNKILLVKGKGNNHFETISTMTAANATELSHLVVFTKNGNTFTVYLDGVQKTQVTYSETLGGGFQIGSIYGGVTSTGIERVSNITDATKKAKVFAKAIRVYDYIINDAQMEALKVEFPYVSKGGIYTRSISADADLEAEGAWYNVGEKTYTGLPTNNVEEQATYYPDIVITTNAASRLTVNANMDTENIEFDGTGKLTIASDGTHHINIYGSVTANGPISVKYGETNLSAVPVTIGESGSVEFDFSAYDFSSVNVPTNYPVTGNTADYGSKVTALYPESDIYRSFTLAYSESLHQYVLTVAPTVAFFQQQAINLVTPYNNGGYVGTGLGKYTISLGETSYSNYADFETAVMSWQTLEDCVEPTIVMNMPTNGFYRIKSQNNQDKKGNVGKYIHNNLYEGGLALNETKDETTIFYVNRTDNTILSYANGLYLDGYNTELSLGSKSNWTIEEGSEIGKYAIKMGNTWYASDWNTTANITYGQKDANALWAIEPVESLPLTLAANSYTSFSAPVPVTIPEGEDPAFYAYIATSSGDGVINMQKVTGDVAANTGLIISTYGREANPSFDIAADGDTPSGNMLKPNWAASKVSVDNYFFAKVNGKYMFTKVTGDGTNYTLPGHKAYLQISGETARMSINWGDDNPTGIEGLQNESVELKDGKYYQNGKVVVVRNGVKYNVAGQIIK